MELTLKNLTKRYGSFTAVSGLNYTEVEIGRASCRERV